MPRTKIFVSYSHKDRDWLSKLEEHVAVLVRRGLVDFWTDTQIGPGTSWEREIETKLTDAKVAVLLVSPAFLASKFIWEFEMPRIEAHIKQGLEMLPLIVRPCAWQLEKSLAGRQARPTDGRALSLSSDSQVDLSLSDFTGELSQMVSKASAEGRSLSPVVASELPPDPTGTWTGSYGRQEIRLVILQSQANSFTGKMEYPNDRIETIVQGFIHERCPPNDNRWIKINDEQSEVYRFAVSFKETGYAREGQGKIDFGGEYLAFAANDGIRGAWFAGDSLVGRFALRRN